jgi:hypothetical protein
LFDFEQQVGQGRLMATANFVLAAWLLARFEDFRGIGFWRIPDLWMSFEFQFELGIFSCHVFACTKVFPNSKSPSLADFRGPYLFDIWEYKLFGMRL